jgi:hypothetical protein
MTDRTLRFPNGTKTVYFKGDCRDARGTVKHMFNYTFGKYSSTVKLSGSVLSILGATGPVATVDSMFENTFDGNRLSEVSEDTFVGIAGTTKFRLFSGTFANNKLTTIPPKLFSGVNGPFTVGLFHLTFVSNDLREIPDNIFAGFYGIPESNALSSTFAYNHHLSKIGVLGVKITGSTDVRVVYSNIFMFCGDDDSVKEITVPAGGVAAIFSDGTPGSVKPLQELYNGSTSNYAFCNSGWEKKYSGYKSIPDNWRCDSN